MALVIAERQSDGGFPPRRKPPLMSHGAPNGSLTELQAGFTWLRQSGTPLAATRECARKRRDAVAPHCPRRFSAGATNAGLTAPVRS
jgi:hypothetical protein